MVTLYLYWFSLAVGAPLLLWFMIAGGEGEGDGGILPMFSINTLAFIAAFFGAVGLGATWLGMGTIETLILASVVGAAAGFLNIMIFTWLRNTGASSDIPDRDIEGTIAQVILPVSAKRRGRIVLDVAGVRTQMTARSVDGNDPMESGVSVIVVGIESNVALVAPLDPELK